MSKRTDHFCCAILSLTSPSFHFSHMAPPRFAGLTGRPLALTVSTVATMGFLLFGYDRVLRASFREESMLTLRPEGVMSGIISDEAFNNMFPATKNDNVMQATVTAVYELGL